MAIPTWLWTTKAEREQRENPSPSQVTSQSSTPSQSVERSRAAPANRSSSAPDSEALERVSSEFELLASPVRLEVLATLAAHDEPLRYAELRTRISIADNGKLNYHLRQLEGLVDGTDGEYALTQRGRQLLERTSL